jgi:hypothetical protein
MPIGLDYLPTACKHRSGPTLGANNNTTYGAPEKALILMDDWLLIFV